MSDQDKTRIVNRPLNILPADSSRTVPTEDQATRLVVRRESGGSSDTEATRLVRPPVPSDGPTRMVSDDATVLHRPEEGKTVLIRPSSAAKGFHPLAPTVGAALTEEGEPVVGWLVIIKGPGRGRAVALGYGWNSIGRDSSQRARLDFGDPQISRLNHAKLLYDPKSRKFTLTLGESPNPTYLRDEVLLGPTKLESGDKIQFGDTLVLFHGLCGENFDWQDIE